MTVILKNSQMIPALKQSCGLDRDTKLPDPSSAQCLLLEREQRDLHKAPRESLLNLAMKNTILLANVLEIP